jgi:hypothetical protein
MCTSEHEISSQCGGVFAFLVRLRAAVLLPSCAHARAAVCLTCCTCASSYARAIVRGRVAVYLPSCVCMRVAEPLPPYVRARCRDLIEVGVNVTALRGKNVL